MKALIREHYAEPLSLSRMAREVGMSVYHFARVFAELEGQPPHKYLLGVRLRRRPRACAPARASPTPASRRLFLAQPLRLHVSPPPGGEALGGATPAIADLRELDPRDDVTFGGKAAGLARLIAAGAHVPAGVALAAATTPPGPETAAELRRRAAPLLAAGPLAVRSSARGEDSARRSFAGLFETVLGVGDLERLDEAVARCIASGAAERVRAYSGVAEPLPVGVVVQSQVAARVAGVCFTVDPLGRDRAIVVEAVAGLGDALVSGRAQPERWRVYRSGLGGWEAQRDEAGTAGVLEAREAVRIAAESARLAESAVPGRSTWSGRSMPKAGCAGSRPVPSRPPSSHRAITWTASSPRSRRRPRHRLGQLEPARGDAPTVAAARLDALARRDPSGRRRASLRRPRRSRLMRHIVPVDRVNGRLYWNMNALLAGPLGGLFLRFLGRLDARAGEVARALIDSGVLLRRRLPARPLTLAPRFLWAGLRSALSLRRRLRPRGVTARMEAAAAAIRGRPAFRDLDGAQLLEELKLFGSPVAEPLHEGQHAAVSGFLVYALAERAFRRHADAHRLLTAGIRGNPTTQISIAADELTAAAKGLESVFLDDALLARSAEVPGSAAAQGRAWLAALRRLPGALRPSLPERVQPRDAALERGPDDDPRAGARGPVRTRARERVGAPRAARRGARPGPSPRPRARRLFWLRPVLPRLARLVEEFMPLREAPKHYALAAFQRMRGAALELGRRFAEAGIIPEPDDVFFLELSEVRGLALGERPADAIADADPRASPRTRAVRSTARAALRAFGRSAGARKRGPGRRRGAARLAGLGRLGRRPREGPARAGPPRHGRRRRDRDGVRRPRLDSPLPARGRRGDGSGRRDVPRRGDRARAGDPGRVRRERRHRPG